MEFSLVDFSLGGGPGFDVAKEAWGEQPSPFRTTIEYLCHIDHMSPIIREHMEQAQRAQQKVYNCLAQAHEFQPGGQGLLLVSSGGNCKILVQWQGPFTVAEKVDP